MCVYVYVCVCGVWSCAGEQVPVVCVYVYVCGVW